MATKKKTTAKSGASAKVKKAGAAGGARTTTRKAASAGTARPRIRTSHAAPDTGDEVKRPRAKKTAAAKTGRTIPQRKTGEARPRTAVGAPKRTGKRATTLVAPAPEPTSKARALALALAEAGLDKKAIGVEILDVTGKVDYADFLVVMTGRSDRHVHAIATGIDEALRTKQGLSPISIEGLGTATWVLIDYSDVVVHVFQEEARALYDIEGLWIDASRVPVPEAEAGAPMGAR